MRYAEKEELGENYIKMLDGLSSQGFYSLNLGFEHASKEWIDRFIIFKESEQHKETKGKSESISFEIDDDDDLIPDPYFASILNMDREIQVSGFVYVYTIYGLFYTAPENLQILYSYIASLDAGLNPPRPHQVNLVIPTINGPKINECIDPLNPCFEGGGGTAGTGSTGGSSSTVAKPSIDELSIC